MKDRTLFTIPLTMSLLLLPLGCGDIIGPSESCSGQPANTTVKFEDANLEWAVRFELSVGGTRDVDDLTCALVSGLTRLSNPSDREIKSLAGAQNLTGLTYLDLAANSVSDISPLSGLTGLMNLHLSSNRIGDISALSGLTNLTILRLHTNWITDISALSGLTGLTTLDLRHNSITDISPLGGLTSLALLRLNNNPDLANIQPLLDNTGLGVGDSVHLYNTNVSCADVAALEAKGVLVSSACP